MSEEKHLTPDEAVALLRQYRESGDTKLRDCVVEAHLYAARLVARRFSNRGVDYDDLYQVACLALLKAAERYDPDLGVAPINYFAPAMAGEVKNYFRDKSRLIRPPRKIGENARLIREAQYTLEQQLHRAPRLEELARETKLGEDEVLQSLEYTASLPLSLDEPIGEDGETRADTLTISRDIALRSFEDRDAAESLLRTLPEQEQQVMRLRFFDGLSQRETAKKLGISQMSISRYERAAIGKLRQNANNFSNNGD